jgi:PAS domain S-box-containing protein
LASAITATLQIVCQFAGWDLGVAWLPEPGDSDLRLFAAWHPENRKLSEFVSGCRVHSFPHDVGMPGRVWMRREPEWTANLAAEPTDLFPLAPLAAQSGIRAVLGVPVVYGGRVLAVLLFYMFESTEKDDHSIEVVSAMATQLGFVLHHKQTEKKLQKNEALLRQAREELETRVQGRTVELARINQGLEIKIAELKRVEEEIAARARQQAAVVQLGQCALGLDDLFVVMDEACVVVAETLGVEYCNVLELLPEGNLLLRAGFGWKEGFVGQEKVGAGIESQAGYSLFCGKPVIVEDLSSETRFTASSLLRQHGVVSGASVVISGRDRSFGVLGAHTITRRAFNKDDIHFLESVANVLSEAIERKKTEGALERSAAWLRNLIATTQDAVVSIDRRGCVVLFNPAAERIFGYAKEEIAGKKVNGLMAEPYASEHDEYIARYERTGETRAIGRIRTVTAKRKNGERFPIELSVTEIEVDQDIHYAAFIRDISEKVKLQERGIERERLAMIGSTAAKIGHELANPLNGISLTIQLLEQWLVRQPNPDSQVTATVQRLKNEISRLNQLAGQFRALSRRERYKFQPAQLASLIDDVIRIQRPHFSQLNVEIEHFVPADLPILTVDADKIKQALLNLLKNAAEAMPGGGKINIDACAAGDSVLIEITDTGAGIPSDVDPFEPFETTKKEGTGIGLVIVRQILTAHGGKISYHSRLGEGTTFRLELPVANP